MSILVDEDRRNQKLKSGLEEHLKIRFLVPMEVRDYGRVVILVASFFILNT
jgi:hypothetical protein